MTNYLFRLALGEWKQIKFQFLFVYFWNILFIIRREMFLHSGENCNNYILYAVTKQNSQLCFLFKMSTLLKTSLWEHILLYFFFYIKLTFFPSLSRLFNKVSNQNCGRKSYWSVSLGRFVLQTEVWLQLTHTNPK